MPPKPKSTGARSSVSPAVHSRLVALLSELAQGEGFIPSRLPGVKLMRSTEHFPRTPVVYDQSIVIIAQGRKTGHLGGRTFIYDANNYLVLAMPMPFECERGLFAEARSMRPRNGSNRRLPFQLTIILPAKVRGES